MVKRGNISLLNQLMDSLEEASEQFEVYYLDKDIENFNRSKKFMLNIQKKIMELLE